MKYLVTGASGQLGQAVMRAIKRSGQVGVGTTSKTSEVSTHLTLDIRDAAAVVRVVATVRPDVIIHCAAWTAVDAAEDKKWQDLVWQINVEGTANLARAAREVNAKLIYLSSDYVFNGNGQKPWQADDKCYQPINFYGQSKLAGELAVARSLTKYFIVRTSWVFGLGGSNFVEAMLKLATQQNSISVVADQIGPPTYTEDLACLLVEMAASEQYGYYHASNEGGYLSWAEFATEIFKQANQAVTVLPVTSTSYMASKAPRPHNSRLDKSKLVATGFSPLPSWQDALRRYLRARQQFV
ncbi:dTDP-4-dehydrorhamnose reductase [Ligilactobacillus equi]